MIVECVPHTIPSWETGLFLHGFWLLNQKQFPLLQAKKSHKEFANCFIDKISHPERLKRLQSCMAWLLATQESFTPELVPHINTLWWPHSAGNLSSDPLNKASSTPIFLPVPLFLAISMCVWHGGVFIFFQPSWRLMVFKLIWCYILTSLWISHTDNSSFWQTVKHTPPYISWICASVAWPKSRHLTKHQDTYWPFCDGCDFPFLLLQKVPHVFLVFTRKLRNLHLRDRLVAQILKTNVTHFHLLIYFPLLLHQHASFFFWILIYFWLMPWRIKLNLNYIRFHQLIVPLSSESGLLCL